MRSAPRKPPAAESPDSVCDPLRPPEQRVASGWERAARAQPQPQLLAEPSLQAAARAIEAAAARVGGGGRVRVEAGADQFATGAPPDAPDGAGWSVLALHGRRSMLVMRKGVRRFDEAQPEEQETLPDMHDLDEALRWLADK